MRALLARRGSDGPFVFGGAREVSEARLYKRWERIRRSAQIMEPEALEQLEAEMAAETVAEELELSEEE
ncbi:MAG: hypothetical protein AAFV09_11355, partial [Pseudomonadota bacterium]